MSNPQVYKTDIENAARVQQTKINARLTALQAAQTLMSTPGFVNKIDDGHKPNETNSVDHVCLLAMAGDIEAYIMGNLEDEAKRAIEVAQQKLNGPKIVRP